MTPIVYISTLIALLLIGWLAVICIKKGLQTGRDVDKFLVWCTVEGLEPEGLDTNDLEKLWHAWIEKGKPQ